VFNRVPWLWTLHCPHLLQSAVFFHNDTRTSSAWIREALSTMRPRATAARLSAPGCVETAPPLLQRDRQTDGQTDGRPYRSIDPAPHTALAVPSRRPTPHFSVEAQGWTSHPPPLARQPISCYYYACDLSYFDVVLCQIPQCSLASLAPVPKVTPSKKILDPPMRLCYFLGGRGVCGAHDRCTPLDLPRGWLQPWYVYIVFLPSSP